MAFLAFAVLSPRHGVGQPPPTPAVTIEKLMDDLTAIRKQRDELAKQEAAKVAEIKSRLDALNKRFEDLVGPVKPDPDAAFLAALRAAFASEQSPTKADELKALLSLYRATVATAKEAGTWGKLYSAMAATAKELGLSGKLSATQKVVSQELVKATVNPREQPDAVVTDEHVAALRMILASLEKLP